MKFLKFSLTLPAFALLSFAAQAVLLAAPPLSPSGGVHVADIKLLAKSKSPAVGKNKLDILIQNSVGEPALGMKVTASVAMTSMDMGTSHPDVKEIGKGHYSTTVEFTMDGPWRLSLAGKGKAGDLSEYFDFKAGSVEPWKMPGKPSTEPGGQTSTTMDGMGAMKMDSGMKMEAMHVPQLAQKGVVTAGPNMTLAANAGFGDNAPMVAMMHMMMVGGGGMEGMKMAPMEPTYSEATFAGPGVATGAGDMAGMAGMGATEPRDGLTKEALRVEAKLSKPSVGDNTLAITILTKDGKPVTDAKVTTSVAMTSMDMGTTHPAVKNLGKGKYSTTVNFGMGGPWKVTLTVSTPNEKAHAYSFTFEAK